MDKIQIAFFFISGFFVSRIVIKTEIPELLAGFLLHKRKTSLTKIILYLVALSAFLSFFIPNVITILTLLPLLNIIIKAFEKQAGEIKAIPTILALSVMYGANIGGMGSITATPANGILITFLGLNNVPGSENLTFATWLLWGIPLVIIFILLSWLILLAFFHPGKKNAAENNIAISFKTEKHHHYLLSIFLTVLYFFTSFIFSLLIISYPEFELSILILTGVYTVVFTAFIFIYPLKSKNESEPKSPLMQINDCFSNLPLKGFVYVGISVAIAGVLYLFNLHEPFSVFVNSLIPSDISVFILFLSLALLTSFSTELLSNTAVQLSLFIIALPLVQLIEFPLLEALIIITLSSTCAFMSPIATGVNGLAFGGVKGMSLKKMLIIGFVMNIVGAVYLSTFIRFIVPLFL